MTNRHHAPHATSVPRGRSRGTRWLGAVAAVALIPGLAAVGAVEAATTAPGPSARIEKMFDSPDLSALPMARMWFPDAGAGADAEGLALVDQQIRDMSAGGFGGVEVSFLSDTTDYDNDEAAEIGWGSENWRRVLKQLLSTANSIEGGFKVDITITSHWPPIVNNIDPNDDAQQQQATHAYEKVTADDLAAGTMSLPLPDTRTEDFANAAALRAPFLFVDKFAAATIARVASVGADGDPVLEMASLQDVSGATQRQVAAANAEEFHEENGVRYAGHAAGIPDREYAASHGLDYEADVIANFGPDPADADFDGKIDADGNRKRMADWQFLHETDLGGVDGLASYEPSAGAGLAPGDFVLFGTYRQGTGQIMSGGSSVTIHNRSYATDYFSEEGVQRIFDFWDDRILDDEMRALLRANGELGTSIFEDSIEIHNDGPLWTHDLLTEFADTNGYDPSRYAPVLALGDSARFDDSQRATRIVEDKNLALGELYEDEHASLISDWASEFGYTYRAQAYRLPGLDIAGAAAAVDIPEGDNSTSGDGLRNIAAAVNLTGGDLVSMETTTFTADINSTWRTVAREVNRDLSHGVNRSIFHGSAFARSFNGFQSAWPGWNFVCCGNRSFSSYNARQIWWDEVDTFSDYVARSQAVMQHGASQVDVAVLLGTEAGYSIQSGNSFQQLLDRGYSYNLLSEALLDEPSATVSNGVLAPDGPAYRALVVRQATRMSVGTAERLVDYAKAGLPVVLFDTDVERVYGTDKPGNNDVELAAELDRLRALPNVRSAGSQAEVLSLLDGWDVGPTVSHDVPGLEASHRAAADGDYFYLYSATSQISDAQVTLGGRGTPYLLDAWTGEVEPIAEYSVGPAGVTIELDLEQRDAAIVALAPDSAAGRTHVTGTSGGEVRYGTGATLVHRADEPGDYQVSFSNGRDAQVSVPSVPADVSLDDGWELDLESWGPDAQQNAVDPTASAKTTIEFENVELGPWSDLPADAGQLDELGVVSMNEVSGIGTYRGVVDLPSEWSREVGALLRLDHGDDMVVDVTVNGRTIDDVDQFTNVVDLGTVLSAGANEIEITVASTLARRMVAERGGSSAQSYGLASVLVDPYVLSPLRGGR